MTQAYQRLLQGRTLAGRYEVRELIGSGGMSVVYRAVDRNLGRPVAVKVVSLPAGGGDARADLRARFRREAAAAASIPHHPNVVQIYDYGTDPELDLDFIVMELLQGRDLKEAAAAGGLSLPESVRVLREAARGLAAGHRVGLVHRDVKPANVFLTGGEEIESVCLLDFGIAKPLEAEPAHDLTRTGMVAYSPAYASPEQLRGARVMTPASDVYQLGLIGYELLAGERPFEDDDRERIRAGEDVPLPVRGRWAAAPAELRAVLERALRIRPEERFPDAGAMAEA
ncbi:MAG TPA: serine/threonine-protein kinase, partial [Longimicrobiaceae bacterium]|nr:serine/threonine-protein kinase [Longimicrobiaceae bacterium]